MGKGIFVTATGTDVGKTYVTALLVKKLRDAGLNAGYYKAALSGAELRDGKWVPGDAEYVARVSGMPEAAAPEQLVSYIYKTAVSPHLAAQLEGTPVELDVVKRDYAAALAKYDYLTMEGSGGIICPIRWDAQQHMLLEDIIRALGLGTLVVTNSALGSINALVTTVHYLRTHDIDVRGIIVNEFVPGDTMHEDNVSMMQQLTGLPVLAKVHRGDTELQADVQALQAVYR